MKTKLVLLFFVCVILFSCTKNDKVTIGFMVPNYIEARYIIDRDNFVKRANELGAEVIVENANNDDRVQIEQAKKLISQGVDAIVINAVNQITAAAISREAKSKGIKVIAYERLIQNCELDYFITFDHHIAGKLMAEYALSKHPEGNYVLISGDKTDKNAELIYQGNMELLSAAISAQKINLIFSTYIEDWSAETAYIVMKKVINYSAVPIDVVISANDGMASGIIKALEEKGLAGKVLVTGMDAEIPACKRIAEGTQAITIYKPMTQQAIAAADITMKIIKGEKVDENVNYVFNGKMNVPSIQLIPITVDKNNIRQTIIADKFHTEQEIFGNP